LAGWCAWLGASHPWQSPIGPVFWGVGLIVALATASALNVFNMPGGRGTHAILGLGAGAAAALLMPTTPLQAAVMVGGGCVIHMVGDTLTVQGCPWLGPIPGNLRLPILGKAGSVRESLLTVALAGWAVYVAAVSGNPILTVALGVWGATVVISALKRAIGP
jgi:membrane-bound metal-dependent hydrolase YbcI (DUF457 family)